MPDTKPSGLTALTGANLATGDLSVITDVSATEDKKMTQTERLTGQSYLISNNRTVAPGGVGELFPGSSTTVLASTFDRMSATETNSALLVSQRITIVRILLPVGLTVTSIRFFSMTTALNTGVNQWFALFDASFNKLAVTSDDTNVAWAANTAKTLNLSAPYTITASGIYYLGIMVRATTVPSLAGGGSASANYRGGAAGVFTCASADAALTTPASCPNTLAAPNSLTNAAYAEVI